MKTVPIAFAFDNNLVFPACALSVLFTDEMQKMILFMIFLFCILRRSI